MVCKPAGHFGDIWSDLSLSLKMGWPLSLILTPDLMEVFERIHKFLFPIRQIQIQLEQSSSHIPRYFREQKQLAPSRSERKELEHLERRMSCLRWRMGLAMGSLWAYFEADVVETAWLRLRESILSSSDFEEVIRMISKYVNTIQAMYYFNASRIQRSITELVRECRSFVAFLHK